MIRFVTIVLLVSLSTVPVSANTGVPHTKNQWSNQWQSIIRDPFDHLMTTSSFLSIKLLLASVSTQPR